MRSFWPAIRFSAGLVSLCLSVFFIACLWGSVPDADEAAVDGWLARGSLVAFVVFFSAVCVGILVVFLWPFFRNNGNPDNSLAETRAGQNGAPQDDGALQRRVSDPSSSVYGDDNLTNLERKHAQLCKVLDRLRVSRKVVRRHNHELKALATRDSLTGCFNRRTLFIEFEKLWSASKRYKKSLSCVMVDVDHFKAINDRFGHQAGDEVLKQVAELLRVTARKSDIVCRYGGEEFCILLPHVDLAEAEQAGERFRQALASAPMGEATVTASFGVSSFSLGALHPQEMLEQADKALFAAKRFGRNKVMRFDLAPKELLEAGKGEPKPLEHAPVTPQFSTDHIAISFQAVSGLLAALGYRHAETAEHCRRVADLCVLAAGGLMSQKDAYLMEMAALLHDIGKLGVPDNVLLKPGPLTPEEWKTIRTHESMGVEIIRAAFTSDELANLVRLQHCWFGGTPADPSLPKGQKIPLAARLIAVANAYDSMTNEHSYRKALSQADALSELRRCAGTQFDPIVTEHFIAALTDLTPARKGSRVEPSSISKLTALKIGVQIEKLAMAADVQDLASLISMANQLRAMAQESGIASIAEAAAKLEQSAAANSNQMDLMELTIDLLEMCRQTQRTLLPAIPKSDKPKRIRPKTSDLINLDATKPTNSPPTPINMARPAQFVRPKSSHDS